MTRRATDFQTIRSEGGLLPPDLLRRVLDPNAKLAGTRPEDYGLPQGERINEVITQSWNRLRKHWGEFRAATSSLPEGEPGTGLTNDKWSLPLLRELGFGLLPTSAGPDVSGRTYAINRFFGPVPVHLVGCGLNLDRRAAGVRGAAAPAARGHGRTVGARGAGAAQLRNRRPARPRRRGDLQPARDSSFSAGDGLVRASENFMAWLRGEKTMPFGKNGEHVSVRLVDAANPGNNRCTVANQWTFQAGAVTKRFDVVFVVNGLPLVIGEAKTPARSSVTWFDGAFQVNQIYEKEIPAMFVPNVFSFATESKCFRYGSIRMPIEMWGPWRDEKNQAEDQLHHVKASVQSMLRPHVDGVKQDGRSNDNHPRPTGQDDCRRLDFRSQLCNRRGRRASQVWSSR